MQIYNTMTRKKEELIPLVPGQIFDVRLRTYGL